MHASVFLRRRDASHMREQCCPPASVPHACHSYRNTFFINLRYVQLDREKQRVNRSLTAARAALPLLQQDLTNSSVVVSSAMNPKLSSMFILCHLVLCVVGVAMLCWTDFTSIGVGVRIKTLGTWPWIMLFSGDCLCRQLHNQKHVQELGLLREYDPEERDPSHTQLRIAMRQVWCEEKLEKGCEMLNRGIGQKTAAREAGVLLADLKKYWEENYAHSESDGSDSDY